jgi:hypothetical protein
MKMKGISVWLFSKMVMLIFLLTVFATVLGFLKIVNEKIGTDSAESLATQIRNTIRIVLEGPIISANMAVGLPKTLPEKSEVEKSQETRARSYSMRITGNPATRLIIVAVSWQTISPTTYVAASSFTASQVTQAFDLTIDSIDHGYFKISKDIAGIKLCGCKDFDPCPSTATGTKDRCIP